MRIIQRGKFCNIDDPLDPEEYEVFAMIVRAGDAGHKFQGQQPAHVVISIFNLETRGWIELAITDGTWTYRTSYTGRKKWLQIQKGR